MPFIVWLLLFIMLLIPFGIIRFVILDNQKVYRVVWRYDALSPSSTTLIKAKDRYSAWKKVQKRHAISIDLVEVNEFV